MINFLFLNDLYGEDFGDKILLSFVANMKETFKSEIYNIYRVGSDNFVILCKDEDTDTKEFKDICKQFIKKTNDKWNSNR